MEQSTQDLVSVLVVDKMETQLKSTAMEKVALERSLNSLKEKKMNVAEVTTDAHLQIASMFSEFIYSLSITTDHFCHCIVAKILVFKTKLYVLIIL